MTLLSILDILGKHGETAEKIIFQCSHGGLKMYAIIETGNKQYLISKGDTIEVERLLSRGGEVVLDRVLLLSQDDNVAIGRPYLEGVSVICERKGEKKSPKVISFKYRRRKNSKKKIGHRQIYTVLKVKEIQVK